LIYNEQTVTPLTQSVKKMAADEGIPIVGITETVQPAGAPFEKWMDSEVVALENALNETKAKK
jgi:zinc/manganese transport system substrate-binding protein